MTEPTTSRGADLSPTEALLAHTDQSAVLLDVREPEEWDGGHAPGAMHMPLGDLDPTALDQDTPVITICRSGKRSAKAADALAHAGVPVRNMAGGMNAWQEAGLPTIRDDGSPGHIE
ncbi:rhodanese-like domain-containing protein [Flexivirga caeni]|uniref:Rhodanese-like domain-containing protein n=1 Tax=Flexivirga caeni TaxID=2294115 RepID=A0A3M9MGR6_9MICO|nr:rhodanese-like domain-containing protein [Flexivirga caeni]RNI24749.1 rhodanese-like domain-containing protein [Flexivirga caeni]